MGRNYARHAAELGNEVPSEPLLFLKPPSAVISPGAAIVKPAGVGRVDFEGEIGVVVGRRARRVSEASAWDFVGALLPANDVTARDLQKSDGQWTRAKGFDTFCPLGAAVPVDRVDVRALGLTTRVNGEVRQRAAVEDMVFSIPGLMAYISGIMTLEPGDVILTGTPEGVGPLNAGDVVQVEVWGVGVISNPVEREG
ncbi:MAG: fumarylacetoacetate hydrolase family protein [Gemmatimonadota bacterium]